MNHTGDLCLASTAVHFRILRIAPDEDLDSGMPGMPCFIDSHGLAECFSLPLPIDGQLRALFDPALKTQEALPILECMKQAIEPLLATHNRQRSRRLHDASSQLSNAIRNIISNHPKKRKFNTFGITFERRGVKKTLLEFVGDNPDDVEMPPFHEFLTFPDPEGHLSDSLKPGLGFVTSCLGTGCRILLQQVRAKAMIATQHGGATNFRKARVIEPIYKRSDGQEVTRLFMLPSKSRGSPPCKFCALWVATENDVLQTKAACGEIWSTGTVHFCVATDTCESHISIIPPLTDMGSCDDGRSEHVYTVQLANLREYAFVYRSLARVFKQSRVMSTAVSSSEMQPALRAWLGLPEHVGLAPTVFARSSFFDSLLDSDRQQLIVFGFIAKSCVSILYDCVICRMIEIVC